MSRAGKGKPPAGEYAYWGCTTVGCEHGFNEDGLPEDVAVCPECDGDLTTITVTRKPPAAEPVVPEPSPEVLADLERRARSERMFQLCRGRIIEHYPSLWPGEILGLAIGDQWIRNVVARLAQQRAAATGLVLPS